MGLGFFKWRRDSDERGGAQKKLRLKLKGCNLAMIVKPGCGASRRIANRVLKATQISHLPVPGCKNRHCTCELVQFPSRRVGFDRRSGYEPRATIRMTKERRTDTDRRKRSVDVWKKTRYL